MKKKLIFAMVILVIIIAVIIIIFLPKDKEEKAYNKKETIEEISNGLVNGMSKKDLEKLLNQKISEQTIMTGKDAYLLKAPSNDLIEKYNLDKYVTVQKTYFEKLDSKIKNEYSWKFEGETKGNQAYYYITINVYNYGIYLNDINEIQKQLLENYKATNNAEQEINEYKAKIIAMKLLDSHLDDYGNTQKTIAISFTNIDNDETKASLMQYLVDLAGYNSASDDINARPVKIKNFIEENINNGVLNKQDLLAL